MMRQATYRLWAGMGSVILGAALMSPATAGPSGTSSVLALRGRNLITASSFSVVEVRIPKTVRISDEWGDNPDISVNGGAGLSGLILRRPGSEEFVLMALRLPRGGAFGQEGVEIVYTPSGGTEQGVQLDAGIYDLYVIGDSKTRATLTLPGLSGSATIRAVRPTDGRLKSLTERITAPPPAAVYSAGDGGSLSYRGMTFFALAFTGQAWAAGNYGACVHRGGEQAPPEIRFAPWCPAAAEDGFIVLADDSVVRLQHRTIFFGSVIGLPPDEWAVTTWSTGAAAIDTIDSAAMWLSF